MTSTAFRDSMNSLGWSRRDPDIPVNTSSSSTPILSRLQSLNPFNGGGGYVSLPTEEGPGAPLPAPNRREEEEGMFACEFPVSFVFAAASVTAGRVPACPLPSHAYCHVAYPLAFLRWNGRPRLLCASLADCLIYSTYGNSSRACSEDPLELAIVLDRPQDRLMAFIVEIEPLPVLIVETGVSTTDFWGLQELWVANR